MKTYVLIIFMLLTISQLIGIVAYNGFNKRNHPELNWKSISTKNCQIIYHDPLEPQAHKAAEIAQNTYNAMAKTYQITPTRSCIIYVSDQDNVPNGATVMSQYIYIWINQNDYTTMFTGNDKWMRKVISHEMSHWFVAVSLEMWLTKLVPIYPSFQRPMNEGYAQYFSGEAWGYNRGDKTLKASILSRKAGILSPQFDGNLYYAEGFAKVRYLASVYGEDSLIKLLKYRNKANFYGFNAAFSKVYKKDFSAFEEEWRRYIYTYYYGEVYDRKSVTADTSAAGNINDFTKLKTDYYQFTGMSWKRDKLLYSAKRTVNQLYLDLLLADVVSDSLKSNKLKLKNAHTLLRNGSFTKISLSDNGKWVAWASYTRHKNGRLAPRVYRYDVHRHKTYRFGEGNYPEIDSLGGVYFQLQGKDSNDILYIKPDNTVLKIHSIGVDEQIGNLFLSPDDQKLAFTVFDGSKQFNISILDLTTLKVQDSISLTGMAQSITWNSNAELLYTVESPVDFSLGIVKYNIANHSTVMYADQAYNSIPIRMIGDTMYVMADYEKGAKIPGSFIPRVSQASPRNFSENYYNKWVNIQPLYSIPDSTGNMEISKPEKYVSWQNIKWRMGFALPLYSYAAAGFILSEAMGKQIIGGFAAVPYDKNDRVWGYVMYQNKTLAPTIDFIYRRDQYFSGIGKDKLYYQDMEQVSGKISFPFNFIRPYQSAKLAFDVSYTDVNNANDNPVFDDKCFASIGASTGLNYNLPWKNSDKHPVCSWNADYALQMASKNLGMNSEFNQHSFTAGFAYAPLLYRMSSELFRTISLVNRTNYEFVNGNQLQQFLPGTGQYDIVQTNNKPAYKRYYLRGYEESYLCRKILNVQDELNFKLMDDMKMNLVGDMLSVHFVGFALWYDHTELHNILNSNRKDRTFNANGFEFRAETNFLFIPAILKYGRAYNMSFDKLSDYFLIEIPFLEMFQNTM